MNNDSMLENNPVTAEPGNPTVGRILWPLALIGVAALPVVIGLAAFSIWRSREGGPSPSRSGISVTVSNVEGEPRFVTDFSLIDQHGQPVTLADLKDQIWVANFFFTNCKGKCPMMTLLLKDVQAAVPAGADVKLVSVTVDPDRDSPDVLAKYSREFGVKDQRWLFLTGEKEEILRVANEVLLVGATENPEEHNFRLTLVDRDGRIRGYFDGTDQDSVAELRRTMQAMLDEKKP